MNKNKETGRIIGSCRFLFLYILILSPVLSLQIESSLLF